MRTFLQVTLKCGLFRTNPKMWAFNLMRKSQNPHFLMCKPQWYWNFFNFSSAPKPDDNSDCNDTYNDTYDCNDTYVLH